jgi:uncharacterized membrane protein YdjX (TVP38/TMEM64 family)
MKREKLQKITLILILALMVSSILFYHKLDANDFISEVREVLAGFGIWAPIAFVAIYIVATIFIPSTSFMVIAGILFGFRFGLFYTIIGGFVSAMIVFLVSRKLGRGWVDRVLKHKHMKYLGKYNVRLERGGVLDLLILRALPIMPFNILNVLMGVSKITIKSYIIGTVLGLIPSNLFAVYLGTLIAKIF